MIGDDLTRLQYVMVSRRAAVDKAATVVDLGDGPAFLLKARRVADPPPHQANFADLSVGAAGWFLKASGEIVAVGFSGQRCG